MSTESEIERIEEEIQKTPYHKATQAHIGRLKAKLAKLRSSLDKQSGKSYGPGFAVKKTGDATVLLVGFPSVGKSTLINSLTNAESKTGDYDFTTLDVIPGMLEYRGARIQVLDIPGMIADASRGKGRGRQILSVVRSADLIIILIDSEGQLGTIERELYGAGFRLNQKPPDVRIVKKETGGLNINIAVKKPKLDRETVKDVLNEFRVHNADVIIRENITPDQLIDSLIKNIVYVPSVVVFNKIDKMDGIGFRKTGREIILISALKNRNLEALKEEIWKKLDLVRIYLKPVGKEPDMREPLIMKKGCTVMDVAGKILRAHSKGLKYARIWGASAKFPGKKVGPAHRLSDGDVVELHA